MLLAEELFRVPGDDPVERFPIGQLESLEQGGYRFSPTDDLLAIGAAQGDLQGPGEGQRGANLDPISQGRVRLEVAADIPGARIQVAYAKGRLPARIGGGGELPVFLFIEGVQPARIGGDLEKRDAFCVHSLQGNDQARGVRGATGVGGPYGKQVFPPAKLLRHVCGDRGAPLGAFERLLAIEEQDEFVVSCGGQERGRRNLCEGEGVAKIYGLAGGGRVEGAV